mgnify:CR=1 FL=1
MVTSQTVISREVRQFMATTSSTQSDIARLIGLDQTAVSRRLLGRAHWSLDDLDALRDAGVPLALTTYSVFDSEAVGV